MLAGPLERQGAEQAATPTPPPAGILLGDCLLQTCVHAHLQCLLVPRDGGAKVAGRQEEMAEMLEAIPPAPASPLVTSPRAPFPPQSGPRPCYRSTSSGTSSTSLSSGRSGW